MLSNIVRCTHRNLTTQVMVDTGMLENHEDMTLGGAAQQLSPQIVKWEHSPGTDHCVMSDCLIDSLVTRPRATCTLLQAQEYMTALHNVCQQLQSSATGKAAESRLQKVLDKLHKMQPETCPLAADSTGLPAASQQVVKPAHQAAAASQTVALPVLEVGDSTTSAWLGEPSQQAGGHTEDAIMADAVALKESHSAEDKWKVVLPAKDKVAEASALGDTAVAADKSKVAADKKAQKEEAKVNTSASAGGIRKPRSA